ncbi:DUF2267 domain-containing protein [Fodinibius sediminis]|uniref:Uncharacterized conserved protein, DUF2267 family n=1 Tax=Fodinibius sediminis TaxID=1214077 RepID=A0A521CVI7_9BACT|nr:DUF2267 domain-containing protein [Fodinibius sediminis]SMO63435.1 Uncharacterized conserved protein, DUF2267 family [Fodinibius sediminis]
MEELHWYEKVHEDEKGSHKKVIHARKPATRETAIKRKKKYFNKYVEDVDSWIGEVAFYLDEEEREDWAYNALRGVLYALRDRLTPQELFQFSAQLPTLVRGVFFEGYHFDGKPEKYHVDEFLDRIDDALGPAADISPERAFEAVLQVLYDHISEGELNDIYRILPDDLKELWDECLNE